jgi:4-aminobutyrate aminotransferase-like enzyme/Ser/Thr protein kinase RdoA (MazF antagonist)
MSDSNRPRFSETQILEHLSKHYHLAGKLKTLPSYSDLNFRLTDSDSNQWVVKVASSNDSLINLDMQNKAMSLLYQDELKVPKALNDNDGKAIGEIYDGTTRYFFRVLSYLPGVVYADSSVSEQAVRLWQSLGDFMGRLNHTMLSFNHEGAYRYLEWDLAFGYSVCHMKKQHLCDDNLSLVDFFLRRYKTNVMPLLEKLPQGIIHNDANDYNLLVDSREQPTAITGLIDFGDMLHSHLINEVAITCAYAIMGQADPMKVIVSLVKGYHQHRPLNLVEVQSLYYLIALRLCTSLCNSAEAIKKEPENEYLVISIAPAIVALNSLKNLNIQSLEYQLTDECISSNAQLKNSTDAQSSDHRYEALLNYRQTHLVRSLSLSYQQPLKITRGQGAYLYDERGERYLDMVNNVCHVGHCHPNVVAAGQAQMARLNTNTRYLHDNIVTFSKKLLATFPDKLSVCLFVNSGSEANELAFRLAKNFTDANQLIVVDEAYHGNTAACVAASPYKFNGPGGTGQEPHINIVSLPDPYRGQFSGYSEDTGEAYAKDIDRALSDIKRKGEKVAAFICESLQGVAGQIIMPNGYLASAYQRVRDAGGVCIADEVQVGFGRVGTHMWAFETQQVVPDIVTLGKPIGNGHPLAAVITSKEIADAFANGMEYFNTFGGNPVSCAIGEAVLDVIEHEKLQQNAFDTGQLMRSGLRELQQKYTLIGDVRGLGLFVGVELVDDRETKAPASESMSWLIEYFKRNKILLTSEGPFYNILKIKPPIVFSQQNVDRFLEVFEKGLIELESRNRSV